MNKYKCTDPTCRNFDKYCRLHLTDVVPEKVDKQKEYLKKKKVYLKDNPNCQFPGCKKKANDLHHKRGRVGDLLTDERYFLGLCRDHHNWVHLNPIAALEMGLSEKRLAKEKTNQ